MQRKALIVAGAAGPEDVANSVLQRFGFAAAETVASVGAAVGRLKNDHADLLVVPLEQLSAVELTILERDLRREESTIVIGTAPVADPDLILRAMRSGVHEFLTFPPDPTEFAAAIDRLLRRRSSDGHKGQVITVYSAKGGLGTTTLAVNLAFAFAQNNDKQRVALADFVVSGGDVRVLLDLKPEYDIGDLVAKVDRVDEELLFSVLAPTEGGVWALAASESAEVSELIDAATASAIINHLRSNFPMTVIDCEHQISDRTLASLDAADKIVLVTQLNVPSLRSTKRTIELFDRLGYEEPKVLIVVNRHHSADLVSLGDAREVLGRDIYWKVPNDYRGFADAISGGKPFTLHAPSSPAARNIIQLAAKLGGGAVHPSTNGAAPKSKLGRLLRLGRKN
jgi:pilus assembly protein CpaE